MTTNTFTNDSNAAAYDFSDFVNEAWKQGKNVTVNGQPVKGYGRHSVVSHVYGNGTVSVNVKARTTNGVNDVWVKRGMGATVVVA